MEHLIITRLGTNADIKQREKRSVQAIFKEMKQLYDGNVIKPLLPFEVTSNTKNKVLGYLMFLKDKRDGEIKGRGCADDRPQQIYKSKAETSSPTVCTEFIFISCAIDAQEDMDLHTWIYQVNSCKRRPVTAKLSKCKVY